MENKTKGMENKTKGGILGAIFVSVVIYWLTVGIHEHPKAPDSNANSAKTAKAPEQTEQPEMVESTKTFRSQFYSSGVGGSWSQWYEMCEPVSPKEGWHIKSASLTTEGDRICPSYAECTGAPSRPDSTCQQFRLQGHSEDNSSRQSRGVVTVVYTHPKASDWNPE
jgi:hypothetical protein